MSCVCHQETEVRAGKRPRRSVWNLHEESAGASVHLCASMYVNEGACVNEVMDVCVGCVSM